MRKTGEQTEISGSAHEAPRLVTKAAYAGTLVLLSGALGAAAQTKSSTVPDAQVESNVLQALAKSPKLANEQISSTAVYGVVTLSGHVVDEPTRVLAENTVARTAGVTKVVDELTLAAAQPADASANAAASSAPPSGETAQSGQQGSDLVLQPDGTYAPANQAAQAATPGQSGPTQQGAPVERGAAQSAAGQAQPEYGQGAPNTADNQGAYPQSGNSPAPDRQSPYGQPGQYGQQDPYGQQGVYGQPAPGPYAQQGPYGAPPAYPKPGQYGRPPQAPSQQPYGRRLPEGMGQQAGALVTVPAGTTIQLRVNQPIDSRHSPAGSSFAGVLQQDVVVGGYVAMPRGAILQGTVVDATSAGALKGRAELGLRLNQLVLGGLTYPVSSNLWSQAGGDKAVRTVNSALGLGALGAIIGGVAGGGAGAAVGAGAGGAAGLGAAAASGGGAVVIPPESLLTFHLNAPLQITTVSQTELNRLAYNVPGAGYGPPRVVRRYPAYYPYGPGYYYPRYYRGYPY